MKLPNLSRRKLFKLSGGGLLAGVVDGAPVKVPPMLAPLAPLESGGVGVTPEAMSEASRQAWRLMDAWRGMRAPNAPAYKVRHGATDLDPDIACLRSVSPCMKAFMQRERDLSIEEQMSFVAKFFGTDNY